MSTVVTLDPVTGEQPAEYAAFTDADIEAALSHADEAQGTWAALPVGERAAVLRRMAAILRDQTDVRLEWVLDHPASTAVSE